MSLCPCCGFQDAYIGFTKVECGNPECTNYKKPEEKELTQEAMDLATAYAQKINKEKYEVFEAEKTSYPTVVDKNGRACGKSLISSALTMFKYGEKLREAHYQQMNKGAMSYREVYKEIYTKPDKNNDCFLIKNGHFAGIDLGKPVSVSAITGDVEKVRDPKLQKIDKYIAKLEETLEKYNKYIECNSNSLMFNKNGCSYGLWPKGDDGTSSIVVGRFSPNVSLEYLREDGTFFNKNSPMMVFNSKLEAIKKLDELVGITEG